MNDKPSVPAEWSRPVYDDTCFMLPRPASWQPKWHRDLTPKEGQEIESLKRHMRWVEDDIRRVAQGHRRCYAYCGPPGIGKTKLAQDVLDRAGVRYRLHTGRISARDLFMMYLRHPDELFLMDDAEEVLCDKQALALMRAACELIGERHLFWRTGAAPKVAPAQTGLTDDELDMYRDSYGVLPKLIQVRQYAFRGRIIVVTNDDLKAGAKADATRQQKTGIGALVDRLQPVDIGHRDRRIALLRIEQLCAEEALGHRKGLSFEEEGELLDEIRKNARRYQSLTIRTFLDAADLCRCYRKDWRDRMSRYLDPDMAQRHS
jgi:hypothetical protein